jgi:hypothetical protein
MAAPRLNFDDKLKNIFYDLYDNYEDGIFKKIFTENPSGNMLERGKAWTTFTTLFNMVN